MGQEVTELFLTELFSSSLHSSQASLTGVPAPSLSSAERLQVKSTKALSCLKLLRYKLNNFLPSLSLRLQTVLTGVCTVC